MGSISSLDTTITSPRYRLLVGQRDEPVRQLRHQRLALVHRADDAQIAEPGVADLQIHQCLRDHADDLATVSQYRVGEHTHQSDVAAAVDERQLPPRQDRADTVCHRGVLWIGTRTRPAKDAHPIHESAACHGGAD